MAEKIIDLRNRVFDQQEVKPSGRSESVIEWSAGEYEGRTRGRNGIFLWGGAALLLISLGVFLRSYFFIAFVVLAYVILLFYGAFAPRKISFSLSGRGVRMGSITDPFSDFESFWIFDEAEVRELSLKTKRRVSPYIRLPLGAVDPEKVRAFLNGRLPEEEHREFLSDRIARKI